MHPQSLGQAPSSRMQSRVASRPVLHATLARTGKQLDAYHKQSCPYNLQPERLFSIKPRWEKPLRNAMVPGMGNSECRMCQSVLPVVWRLPAVFS